MLLKLVLVEIENLVKEVKQNVFERGLLARSDVTRGIMQLAHDFEILFIGGFFFALRLFDLLFRVVSVELLEVGDHLLAKVSAFHVFKDDSYLAVGLRLLLLLVLLALLLIVAFGTSSAFSRLISILVAALLLLVYLLLVSLVAVAIVLVAPSIVASVARVSVLPATAVLFGVLLPALLEPLALFFLDLIRRLELFIEILILFPAEFSILEHVFDQQTGALRCFHFGIAAFHD